MRFDVPVHDSLAVAVVQSLEQLQDVESHVKVVELGVQASEVGVVDILENEGRCLTLQRTGRIPASPVSSPQNTWQPIVLIRHSPGSLARHRAAQRH